MALLTTIPARATVPTPVMIIPKGRSCMINPIRTPMIDMKTEVITIIGRAMELN